MEKMRSPVNLTKVFSNPLNLSQKEIFVELNIRI